MTSPCLAHVLCVCALSLTLAHAAPKPATKAPSSADVLAASSDSDWRRPAPENLVVMTLASGTVVFELATDFAPQHSANIRQLVRAGYYDGLAVIRVQDNYVSQWGDAHEDDDKARPKPTDLPKISAEFERPRHGLHFTALPDRDAWANTVGFASGWPVALDKKKARAWLTHCYGMVGAARGDTPNSSDGSGLYTVIGHAPRALDLNITSVGRVLVGMDKLSSLPRGTGPLGFYEQPEQHHAITRVRIAADMPESERPHPQVLRTDTPRFAQWLETRRNRSGWFVHNPARVDLCSVLPPVRR